MAASLLDKYSNVTGDAAAETLHHEVLNFHPDWRGYSSTAALAEHLTKLDINAGALDTKKVFQSNPAVMKAAIQALSTTSEKPIQWLVTLFYDILREDASCYSVFEDALKSGVEVFKQLSNLLKSEFGTYTKDKAAWVLSACMGHLPQYFAQNDLVQLVSIVCGKFHNCSQIGSLEAVANLLKADVNRAFVWDQVGVPHCILDVNLKTAQPQQIYKCAFSIWLLSFEKGNHVLEELRQRKVVAKLRDILALCRVEKVVRISLTVLRNLMEYKTFCEEIVEANMLEAVQALEYEKWRDAELYDEIRELCGKISAEVQEQSNFDRYERELSTGSLKWSFIHTSKFWGENVMKFESNDFRAVKALAKLLLNPATDNTTLAVACHDVGEFVALHPLGKRTVSTLQIKQRIMELMGSAGDDKREVRREALLCCQKIMLNKWQDLKEAK
eukprot:TRINITY_DN3087_c0_g2_i1.p1 TRINITY_DN3087_c0_g2~~TRINITY_DN3087_c0_g2_i1.p1  ORF type:complete len:443 (+),score=174.25 TRINITY_DN3087_c0_g2_i1:89-1417(+)